ncbi:hypothetical protein D3C87_925470 [compost metagenome]
MEESPDYFELTPVHVSKEGFRLATAALLVCSLCGEMIDGMGGPGCGAVCLKCAPEMKAGRLRGCVVWEEEKQS